MEEEPAAPATGGDAPAALWQLKSLWNLKLLMERIGHQKEFFMSRFPWELAYKHTLRSTNMAMENVPFEHVFPIEHGDFLLPC